MGPELIAERDTRVRSLQRDLRQCGAKTAKLVKGAKYVVVKDGPHNIAWTHADIVNAELVDFLK